MDEKLGVDEKGVEWAYYHLLALGYVESKFEASKTKIDQLTSTSNRDPEKYKKAYSMLRKNMERAQQLIREHADKGIEHMENALPQEKAQRMREKRIPENKCYERIFITKPEVEYEVKFTSADQLKTGGGNEQ